MASKKVYNLLSEPLTIYEISRKLGVTWNTAKIRVLLEALDGTIEPYQDGDRRVWRRKS